MEDRDPVLLVLAAGMGSRYGGLKQLDVFGPNGEMILDFSIYDAIHAGFRRVVFVIRKSFEAEFRKRMEQRWQGRIQIDYAFQETDMLPTHDQTGVHGSREKPWGTGHAVWVAKDWISGPFGVINADDFYGRNAMHSLFNALNPYRQDALVAYSIADTLSENGSVNRGVCNVDERGYLVSIKECKNISGGDRISYMQDGREVLIDRSTRVSMNMWAFGNDFFNKTEKYLVDFLRRSGDDPSAECYIPEIVQHLIDEEGRRVLVIEAGSHWYGVTYQQDKEAVRVAFSEMVGKGLYDGI
ncbi:MAG: nucleotidyltransferase [Saprospiraceae bacterium]|nr:nucleotidyltransferase [Saprospiraceae bacterium]